MEAGAGVGYYVAQVLEALPLSIGLALDLSKYAVRRAARAHARLDAVVTDLRERLPVRSGVVDVALNVFAPRPASELFRTLNRDGRLIGHFRRNTTLRVLALTHRNPARAWTIASLAEEAGTSRSVLAERFRYYLNESPIAYLTRWRLQLGEQMLFSTSHSVAQIAAEVGYESEAAFNRAFKREFEVPPARFRRSRSTQDKLCVPGDPSERIRTRTPN
jgi:AraC-like DNA-binding protein